MASCCAHCFMESMLRVCSLMLLATSLCIVCVHLLLPECASQVQTVRCMAKRGQNRSGNMTPAVHWNKALVWTGTSLVEEQAEEHQVAHDICSAQSTLCLL